LLRGALFDYLLPEEPGSIGFTIRYIMAISLSRFHIIII